MLTRRMDEWGRGSELGMQATCPREAGNGGDGGSGGPGEVKGRAKKNEGDGSEKRPM